MKKIIIAIVIGGLLLGSNPVFAMYDFELRKATEPLMEKYSIRNADHLYAIVDLRNRMDLLEARVALCEGADSNDTLQDLRDTIKEQGKIIKTFQTQMIQLQTIVLNFVRTLLGK